MARDRSRIIGGAVVLGIFAALAWAERRAALRAPAEDSPERIARNLTIAGIAAATTHVAMQPVAGLLARWVERRRIGAVQRLPLPVWLRDAIAVVLLDYTLYWWHVVEHRVGWLYRFHQVHHADLTLDVTTALRFHFGEFLASVPWRAAQILVIGVSPRALATWNALTGLSVMFHHSNVMLPLEIERRLAAVVMTPRLHGIHHSIVPEEQDSNWSSGLTFWDRLHGTMRGDVPQASITIGVAALREPAEVTLARSMVLPFRSDVDAARLPDGTRPVGHAVADAPVEGLLA